MGKHEKPKFVDYLPPNFVFSVKDPFYYGPATFNLVHYSTAAAICGVLEFVISSVISTAFWYFLHLKQAIESWVVIAAVSLTVMSLLSTGPLFIGISHHKPRLLNPKLILIQFLTLDFELEQGVLGERVQEDKLAYIPKETKLHFFDHVSVLAEIHQLTEKTEAALRIDNEEVVAVRRRYNGVIPCDVQFSFPFETYSCKLRIVAEKAKDKFDIRWATRRILAPPTTGSFKITSALLSTCTYDRSIPSAESATSTNELHGCLEFALILERSLYVAIFRYFAPTTIILLMSWLAFYQRRDKSNIRFIIFCACSLIETIIVLNYLNSSPPASSLTPADTWALLLCINYSVVVFFLFLISMFEARAAKFHRLIDEPNSVRKSNLNRYQKEANKKLLYEKKDMEQSTCSNYDDVVNTVFRKKADSAALASVRLQIAARILCPIVFVISVVLYVSLSVVSKS